MTDEPTANAAHVRIVLDSLTEAGHDSNQICRDAGVDPALFADPNARVPRSQIVAIWREAAERIGEEAFGLYVGRHIRPRAQSVVAYLAISSETLGAALESITRFEHVLGGAMTRIDLRPDRERGWTAFELRIDIPDPVVQRASYEFNLMLMLRFAAWTVGRPVAAQEVWLYGPAPRDPSAHERAFGCWVRFDAPTTTLFFADTDLALASMHANRPLAEQHEQSARRQLSELSRRDAAVAVRDVIRSAGVASGLDLAQAARALSMSTRTLQRRLGEEGTSFQKLHDEMRRELVLEHLVERDTAIGTIAELAGFSDVSAFYRAFRRWTSMTPLQYRNKHG